MAPEISVTVKRKVESSGGQMGAKFLSDSWGRETGAAMAPRGRPDTGAVTRV